MKNPSQNIDLTAIVPIELAHKRLDQVLAELFPEYSRSRLQSWIRSHQILVDGKPLQQRYKVKGNEAITIAAQLPSQERWQAQAIQLNVVYEDKALLVINKPVGLVVHPAAGNPDNTLVNALLHYAPKLATLPRAGIVHRLDKDTSGLLVVARTLNAHTHLVRQLQARTVTREYTAVVNGILIAGGTIDAPIGRNPLQRKKMAVIDDGKPAITHYRVNERFRAHTLIYVKLETGRTHQIRVHMAYRHHALVGDAVYGGRLQLPKGASENLITVLRDFKHQALHAEKLGLIHPMTNKYIEWQAPLPEDLQNLIQVLREDKAHIS